MRHGSTSISPAPEGWQQMPLNAKGIVEAQLGAKFLRRLIAGGCPQADYVVSSDLKRAQQTAAIAAKELGVKLIAPVFELRAYEKDQETPMQYEARNITAFDKLFAAARATHTVPLIVCHRSSTAFLAMRHGLKQNPDYREDALLLEGGLLDITDREIRPLFRVKAENW